jgi:acyl carrier protein
MDTAIDRQLLKVLDEVLSLGGRSTAFTRDTPLLGAVPELDSMAVVSLLTALEERFGITIDDDDIDGSTFATVGSLAEFVSGKVEA